MNTRRDTIDELLARWSAGRTTDEEERTLRDLLRGEEELPADLRSARVLFEGLEALAAERMPAHAERPQEGGGAASGPAWVSDVGPLGPTQRVRDAAARDRRTMLPRLRSRAAVRILWGTAAAAVAAGLFLGSVRLRRPYCYIDGVAVYDPERAMAATHYLDGLSGLAEPGRMVDRLIGCTDKQ